MDLLETARQVIINTFDDFSSKWNEKDFENKEKIKYLKNLIKTGEQIGDASAFGNVFLIPGQSFIIKRWGICENVIMSESEEQNRRYPINQLCEMAEHQNLIFRIPDTVTGKQIVLSPNYLLEPFVGLYLAQKMKNYTKSFMNIYDFQYDLSQKIVYMICEPLEPIRNFIRTKEDYLYTVFGIIQGIDVAQKMFKYVHYDLHMGNIMGRRNPKNKRVLRVYPLSNGDYLHTYFNFEPTIIDYGHSRFETRNRIFIPRLKFFDINWYSWEPYYDLFYFFVFQYDREKLRERGEDIITILSSLPSNRQSEIKIVMFQLLSIFFSKQFDYQNEVDRKNLNNLIHFLSRGRSRPFTELLGYINPEYRCLNTTQMMDKIAILIQDDYEKRFGQRYCFDVKRLETFPYFVSKKNYGETFASIPLTNRLNTKYLHYFSQSMYPTQQIANGILLQMFRSSDLGLTFNYTEYMHTKNSTLDPNNQYIFVATIYSNLAKSQNYKFRFDCCRVDLLTYFQNLKFTSGIGINASFFQINTDYGPLGYYKTRDVIFDNPVPNEYLPYYAIIGIDDFGQLRIDKIENQNKYSQVITCGPVLVGNRKPVITESKIETERNSNGLMKFQCEKSKQFQNVIDCDSLRPGELYHIGNPNPRTALGTGSDSNGKFIKFIYVEGRGNRGSGLDGAQLSNLCLRLGCVDAINLDGGSSTSIVWKKEGEDYIHLPNPNRLDKYPVGSVISLVKST